VGIAQRPAEHYHHGWREGLIGIQQFEPPRTPGSKLPASWRLGFRLKPTPLVGEYNGNGSVDAADYVVWRKNQGTSNPLPNDPTGGPAVSKKGDLLTSTTSKNFHIGVPFKWLFRYQPGLPRWVCPAD
jgi:hypothetical protein